MTETSNSESVTKDKGLSISLDEETNVSENELVEAEEATESVESERFIETENNELLITIDLPFGNEELLTTDEEDPLALQDDQVSDIKKEKEREINEKTERAMFPQIQSAENEKLLQRFRQFLSVLTPVEEVGMEEEVRSMESILMMDTEAIRRSIREA